MWDADRWIEIFQTLRKNKLRTVLTGFTVAFAIMLFSILFGIGKGLHNTFKEQFAGDVENLIMVFPGKTTKAYKGLQLGRRIRFKNDDYRFLIDKFGDDIQYASPLVMRRFKTVYRDETVAFSISGIYPGYHIIEENIIDKGRLLRRSDLLRKSRVAVIGRMVEKDLFGKHSGLGKNISINGTVFEVVGVYSDNGGDREERFIYIPATTMQAVFTKDNYIDRLVFTYRPGMDNTRAISFGKKVLKEIKRKHKVAPGDQGAVIMFNKAESQQEVAGVMMVLNILVLVIGLGTLIAGVIGISNIMVYVVRERTRELGIRKALGATPASIVGMILQETVLITTISGYIGLLLGSAVLRYAKPVLEERFIKDPGVSTQVVAGATLVLVLSGMLAGYLPAKRAARIKPIEALQAK